MVFCHGRFRPVTRDSLPHSLFCNWANLAASHADDPDKKHPQSKMTLDGDTQRQVVPRVPWGRLRAWIDEQESREEEGDVSTVSDLQMKAISQLIPIIEEPQLSGEDYVSALMRYLQARQLGSAKFIDLDPVNVLLQGAAQPRWRCVCKLDCCEGEFPRRDYGLQHSQESPMFVSKKVRLRPLKQSRVGCKD